MFYIMSTFLVNISSFFNNFFFINFMYHILYMENQKDNQLPCQDLDDEDSIIITKPKK